MRSFEDITHAYPEIINEVLTCGIETAPRGQKIKEMLGYQFFLESYEQPSVLQKSRKLNYKYGIVEGLLNILGEYPTDIILKFNKNMENFMNKDTKTWDGAYAPRLKDALPAIFEELKRDPDSRRAVLPIYASVDTTRFSSSLDIPCTLTIQFFIRNGRLDMIVNMRSNDILWGLANDVPQFAILGKALAGMLKIPTGFYCHVAGSMHSYNEREEQLRAVVVADESGTEEYADFVHPVLNEDLETLRAGIRNIIEAIRTKEEYRYLYNDVPACLKPYADLLLGDTKIQYNV